MATNFAMMFLYPQVWVMWGLPLVFAAPGKADVLIVLVSASFSMPAASSEI